MGAEARKGDEPVQPMTPPSGGEVRHDGLRDLTRRIEALERALASRTTIGQAMGIWMHRFSLTDTQAFEYLKKVSQQSNVKLRDVARRLVEQANTWASAFQGDDRQDAMTKRHDEIEASLDELKQTSGRKRASTVESVADGLEHRGEPKEAEEHRRQADEARENAADARAAAEVDSEE